MGKSVASRVTEIIVRVALAIALACLGALAMGLIWVVLTAMSGILLLVAFVWAVIVIGWEIIGFKEIWRG